VLVSAALPVVLSVLLPVVVLTGFLLGCSSRAGR